MPLEVHSVLGASAADRWMNCTPSAQLTAGMEDEMIVIKAKVLGEFFSGNGLVRCRI